jgi:hypothetical protein
MAELFIVYDIITLSYFLWYCSSVIKKRAYKLQIVFIDIIEGIFCLVSSIIHKFKILYSEQILREGTYR